MKKVISLILALLMVASLSITAFAAETKSATQMGSITINGASEGNVYSIYKMLDLSYDEANDAYSYTIETNSVWHDFYTREDIRAYVEIKKGGVVSWIGSTSDEAKATFAKLALNYAQTHKPVIEPTKSTVSDEYSKVDNGIKFSNLELGYYLIDSTMGALCGLTTTDFDAQINAKNAAPTIDKQVQEDSTGQYGDRNTADIGQIVEYMTIINVHAGAQNYVMHDQMSNGLTFEHNKDKKVMYGNKEIFRGVWQIELTVPGTGSTTLVEGEDYEIVLGKREDCPKDSNCTFHVVFDQDFCDTLKKNDKIIVYYNAMLNRNALIADENTNEAWLDFGEGHSTTHDQTKTYTYGFDLVKTNDKNKKLGGAIFKIYDAKTGGSEVAVVILDAVTTDNAEEALHYTDGSTVMFDGKMVKEVISYRRARPDENGVEIIVNGGQVRVNGFDNGTYYLEEIREPAGHNKLTERQAFTISDSNLDAIYGEDGVFSTGSGVHVVNNTGAMLPETGAAGTMLFITFGTFVVLGTGMLLVTKKRMNMIVE